MNADEIRKLAPRTVDGQLVKYYDGSLTFDQILVREQVAQLAELNDKLDSFNKRNEW